MTFPIDRSLAQQGNWKCFERSSCKAITFESKHRLWVEIRDDDPESDFDSEVWTIDKDTMQRIEPTFHLGGLRSGSGSDDGSRIGVSGEGPVHRLRRAIGRRAGEVSRPPSTVRHAQERR